MKAFMTAQYDQRSGSNFNFNEKLPAEIHTIERYHICKCRKWQSYRLLCSLHSSNALQQCSECLITFWTLQWREKKFLSKTSPRKSIGRPGLDPVPLTEAKTFPAFLLGSSAAFLLKGLTLVVLRGRVSGSMEVRRWKFEVTGENAVKQTLEADEEVAPAAVCVADTAVRVTAACMLTNEAAILFRMFPF